MAGTFMRTSALTGTLRPDGEITAGWALTGGTDDASCSGPSGHCSRIDETTLNTADYITTGTSNTAGGEVAEFTMQNPNLVNAPTVSSVTVYFHAATMACVNTSTACDAIDVSISMDNGGTYTSAQQFIMSESATTYSASFTGSWSGINGLQVRLVRTVRASTGNAASNDDDVRLYQMYANFDYTGSTTMEQAAYRWLANQNSVTPGAALAAQNEALINVTQGSQMRLRTLMHIGSDNLLSGPSAFKLQYAAKSGTCDTAFSGETYYDVTTTTPVAYHNNSTPANGAAISATANDPSHSGHTKVNQTYVEANNIDILNNVPAGQDGMWDFSLTVPSDAPLNEYCLRMVHADGSTLNTYTVIPELRMSPSITAIRPSIGPASGGTPFMVTGTFGPNTTVTIGGAAATNIFVVDSSTIIGTTPAGTNGARDVVVTNGSSTATLTGGFTYSSQQKSYSKTTAADFALGTLTNVRAGTIEIGNGAFQWKDFTPSASGGTLATGTYYYAVTALDRNGNETTRSIQTPGVPVTGPNGSVVLKWKPIAGAYSYKLYRTTTSGTYGASSYLITVGTASSSTTNTTVDYIDTGTATSSGQPPVSNTTNAGAYLSRGTVPNSGLGTMSAGPTIVGTSGNNAGQGAIFLERPNGTYLLIQGGATSNTSIYDPSTNSFSAGPSVGGNVDWGGHAFRLPDGRFYVTLGNSTTGRIYDPVANTFSAGPSTTGNTLWGVNSIPLSNGNFLIIHGANSTTTTIYNTSNNTTSAGPATTAVTYVGSHSIKRPDGTWLVARGGSLGTNIYNESTNSFTAGPSLSGSDTCNSGCGSLQMPDGRWLIIHGTASTTTSIYNPWTNAIVAGPTAPAAMHDGRNALEMPDGRWLVIRGNSAANSPTNNTYIYDPYSNSFSAGPTLTATASGETPWLQRPDGTYLIVHGGATSTTSLYNAGWAAGATSAGTYESEAVRPDESTILRQLAWTKSKDSGFTVEYRAAPTREGLASASYTTATNGGTLSIGGKPWIQWRITFTRAIPANNTTHSGNTPGVWGARPAISYRNFTEPSVQSVTTVYDFISNASLMRNNKYFRPNEQLQYHTTE